MQSRREKKLSSVCVFLVGKNRERERENREIRESSNFRRKLYERIRHRGISAIVRVKRRWGKMVSSEPKDRERERERERQREKRKTKEERREWKIFFVEKIHVRERERERKERE